MAITLDHSVTIGDGVVFREIGDESVILNLDTGIYFGLDAVGTAIWRLLQERGALRAVYEALLQQYDVAPEVLEGDLLRLMEELQAKALVHVTPSQAEKMA